MTGAAGTTAVSWLLAVLLMSCVLGQAPAVLLARAFVRSWQARRTVRVRGGQR
jgi:hypothetical protein